MGWTGKKSYKIQELINNLPENGGKVKLPEGIFTIDQTVVLRDHVWLQGAGRGTVLSVTDNIGIIFKGLKGAQISDLAI